MPLPLPAIKVEYLLEDLCKEVIQFSSISVTWVAYDKPSALMAAASLLARGFDASYFAVPTPLNPSWHVQATFH